MILKDEQNKAGFSTERQTMCKIERDANNMLFGDDKVRWE